MIGRDGALPPVPRSALNVAKGLPETDRLILCEARLAELPGQSQIVVWLVVDNAALPDQFLQLGPVWLFDGRYWPKDYGTEHIVSRIDPGLPEPPEFDDWGWASHEFARLPAGEHRVYARVTLEDTMTTSARTRARRVLQEMIDLAKSDSDWILLDGALSWRTTGWSGESYSVPDETDTHPVKERTATELQRFDANFIPRWVDGDRLVAEGRCRRHVGHRCRAGTCDLTTHHAGAPHSRASSRPSAGESE